MEISSDFETNRKALKVETSSILKNQVNGIFDENDLYFGTDLINNDYHSIFNCSKLSIKLVVYRLFGFIVEANLDKEKINGILELIKIIRQLNKLLNSSEAADESDGEENKMDQVFFLWRIQ